MNDAAITFSIVVPVYKSAEFIHELHARLSKAVQSITASYEIIYVNDGSPDASLTLLQALHATDPHIAIINLSRNFGQFAATRVGLSYAKGDYIYVTDADLEEAPEWLPKFYSTLQATDTEIVYGMQSRLSPHSFSQRIGAKCWRLIAKYWSDIALIENYVTTRLMRRRYVQDLLQFHERTGGMYILCQLAGHRHAVAQVEKSYRGASSYNFRKKCGVFIDHVVSATSFPILCLFLFSGFMLLIATIHATALLNTSTPLYFTRLILASIWSVGGLLGFAIGIAGIYLSRLLLEAKQRPIAIVESVVNSNL